MNTTKGSEQNKVDKRRTTELNTRKNSNPLDKFNKRKNTVSDKKTLDSQKDFNVTNSTGISGERYPTKPGATAITIVSKDLEDGNEERKRNTLAPMAQGINKEKEININKYQNVVSLSIKKSQNEEYTPIPSFQLELIEGFSELTEVSRYH